MTSTELNLNLNPTLGTMFVAVVVAAVFYGITTLQTLFYYSTYPRDNYPLKTLVAFLWMLDGLSLVMISYGVYTYLVIDYMDPLALETVNRFYGSEPFCAATIAFVVHEFLVYRIWCLDGKFAPLVVFMYEVAPTILAFEVFESLVTKSYVNTFMATLNVRNSVRGKGLADTAAGETCQGGNIATLEFHHSFSNSTNVMTSVPVPTPLTSDTPKEQVFDEPYGMHTV
ncbi:hypothetical protein FOMPIDRAFT_84937 [Fomitopsis schrenkii]|uniref:Uncharacterized protein n=1 Tax=Fomitopsis schrenkii TaxID=2126942 RepID=S8E8H1_FOMSC|nr:hypothetical protein FOMPIDRAFT_84937 [Fomitopsis schrenkii]